jgi:hypothetical protein
MINLVGSVGSATHVRSSNIVSRVKRFPLLADAGFMLAFLAAITATNLALTSFPNVKLFDVMVFVAGYTLGFRRGSIIAAVAWVVYANTNPWGLVDVVQLGTLMISETVYAGAGAMIRKCVSPARVRFLPSKTSLVFGLVAVVCTITYDLLTNLYTAYHWAQLAGSADYWKWILATLFNPGAIFFSAAHLSSNVLFFTAFAPLLIRWAQKLKKT